MSWIDASWSFRVPVTFDNTSGSAAIDGRVTVPATFSQFWDHVLSTGFDVRVTAADGVTPLTFKRSTWDYANAAAVIDVDNWAPGSADASVVAFLYWGRVAAPDAASVFTALSPKLGSIELATPRGIVVDARGESPGTTTPSQRIEKKPAETRFVYIAVESLLAPRSTLAAGSRLYEEIQWIQFRVTDGAVDQPGMYDETATRVIESGGQRYARVQIAAGAAAEDYTLETTIRTSLGQAVELRHLLRVRTPAD